MRKRLSEPQGRMVGGRHLEKVHPVPRTLGYLARHRLGQSGK
jgi:hypothetical protein